MSNDELRSALERLDALLVANSSAEPGTPAGEQIEEQIKLVERLERFLNEEDESQ